MHTRLTEPEPRPAPFGSELKMIYLFGARIPATQEVCWYGSCGVCDIMHTYRTYGEALELVNVHARTHYGPVI